MKIVYKLLGILVGLSLMVSIFLTVIDLQAFNWNFYKKEYEKLNHEEVLAMNAQDLKEVTLLLFDYIKAKENHLDVQVTVNNQEVEMFNEKEKAHMVDVQILYLNAMMVRNGSLAVLCLITLGLWIFLKKKGIKIINQGIVDVFSTIAAIGLALGLYAWIDFEGFWLNFHYLFFTNDLFFLNPQTDRLIQLVPQQFFFDLVIQITLWTIVGCLVVYPIANYWRKKL